MAAPAAEGRSEPLRRRGLMLPFFLVGAAFGAAEIVVESVLDSLFTTLNIHSQGQAVVSLYNTIDATIGVALVPFALFLAFYLLASRRETDLRRSYLSIVVSIFVGTVVVFLPVEAARAFSGTPSPGFTVVGAAIGSVGGSINSSLNHAFVGFSAVFLWHSMHKTTSTGHSESPVKPHGLEDLSIVGVVMAAVYVWEYLARAYYTMYPLGVSNQLATVLASLLGAASPDYYAIAIWQQLLLLTALPFAFYFLIARQQELNPFAQGRKIAIILFIWGLFLRSIQPFFYIYFARLFDPNAFPSATLGSAFAEEFVPVNFLGIVASSSVFLFLGITALAFAFFSLGEGRSSPAPPAVAPPLPPQLTGEP